nr:MAG TPA: hypothetical protein [Caudoviricetes sp.]
MSLIHCGLCRYEAWKTSGGSTPSIIFGRGLSL